MKLSLLHKAILATVGMYVSLSAAVILMWLFHWALGASAVCLLAFAGFTLWATRLSEQMTGGNPIAPGVKTNGVKKWIKK